jgi:hypothetical protein
MCKCNQIIHLKDALKLAGGGVPLRWSHSIEKWTRSFHHQVVLNELDRRYELARKNLPISPLTFLKSNTVRFLILTLFS